MTDEAPGALSSEEVELEADRWGLRFARPETETAYWAWQHVRAIPFHRAAAGASLVFWAFATLLLLGAAPPGIAIWAPLFGFMFVINLAIEWTARRASPSVARAAGLIGISSSGLVGVGLGNLFLHEHAFALAGAVFALFLHHSAINLRLRAVWLATAPYVVLEHYLLVAAYQDGSLGAAPLAFETFILYASLSMASLLAAASARAQRVSYGHERIIEAQKATIAKERARSEALLKQELSHQVAERSRELGAVLARSDVTLDVRRLSPGERFDARYRIVAALGAGGMGAVYEVERLTNGATLALKAVVGEVSGASAARFAREAEIGARIHHPNLVSIVDVGVSAGVPFLVMELVRGGSLESQRARFGDVAWALPILRQIAEGLAALHDAGVVHRDLKPANVLLSGDVAGDGAATTAKISDFGISRFGALDDAAASIDPNAATVGPSASPRPSALTGTGMVMGTPLYMAPEAARGGRAVDAPADVFALGIIAYEMLTGRAPFSVPAVMLAMAEQPVPAVAPIEDARMPTALGALVLECLAAEPTKRPRVRRLLGELP